MIRGGYEERSDRSGCFGGDRAAAGKFVHRPQESDGREARSGERRLGAGGRRPATAGGVFPQFCGGGGRIFCGGEKSFWRYLQKLLRLFRRAVPGCKKRRRQATRVCLCSFASV